MTENATEHLVVIIDAGSRKLHFGKQRKKSRVNTDIMHNFWKRCAQESATNIDIQHMWQYQHSHSMQKCLETATETWRSSPFLTEAQESTCALWQAMIAKNSFRRSVAHTKSAYKIMELVGRFTAEDQWSAACALVCYRASEELHSEMFSGQYGDVLDELYQRITRFDEDAKLHEVMVFWGRLHEYRESRMLQSSEEHPVTSEKARKMLDGFKHEHLWYELTREQQQSKGWWSKVNVLLHKKAGWTHAARAIMENGLPKLEQAGQFDDAIDHINVLGQFARSMAEWLEKFASSMHAYRQTETYQRNYQSSMNALEERRRRG